MKTKLTVTVDREILPRAKEAAQARGKSLSQLVEDMLRELAAERTESFSERWRGKFRRTDRKGDPLYQALAEKYLEE
ncbi:MAG: ribbon-helix-helix protein, CopG family [Gemmatimonas sp.]|nr:ribbon-helix-helix protein, CopG family [Gemmatimonas sp.]